MSLYQEMLQWQEELAALLQRGEELSLKVAELERQNASLQKRLAEEEYQGDGFDALASLYDEGFHICPGSFGQSRTEDCLFCLNFLRNKGNKQDDPIAETGTNR